MYGKRPKEQLTQSVTKMAHSPNKIFESGKLTDFEQLLFERSYTKELNQLLTKAEIEMGKLKSELDESADRVIRQQKEIADYKKRNKGETAEFRKDAYISELLSQLHFCQQSNRKQKDAIGDLILKIKRKIVNSMNSQAETFRTI